MNKKKFISIIWGYHKQIFNFERQQNYHMTPLEVMKEQGYNCEIFAIDSKVRIEDDPNFIKGTKVIYYKNIFQYFIYLLKNRKNIFYSNSLTIKSLIVGLFGKKTFFYPHSFPFGGNLFKKDIIIFFYKFFKNIRINNLDEFYKINKIKNNLAFICPLSISKKFYFENSNRQNYGTWIGNITDIKNPEVLLKVGKRLKENNIDFVIKIIGEDRYNKNGKNFKELIKEKNLEKYIKVLGYKKPEEIIKILEKSLIYINTSVSEGQCLSVFEGALTGNYLCLQNILSFPSVFNENAFYHNNEYELFKNIEFILENKEKLNNRILKNQEMILSKYNYEKEKECLKNMFLEN